MMHKDVDPAVFFERPIEQFTLTDLTDALGILNAATILGVTRRLVYTMRNTNILAVDRRMKLVSAVRADEAACRSKLVARRQQQLDRARTRGN